MLNENTFQRTLVPKIQDHCFVVTSCVKQVLIWDTGHEDTSCCPSTGDSGGRQQGKTGEANMSFKWARGRLSCCAWILGAEEEEDTRTSLVPTMNTWHPPVNRSYRRVHLHGYVSTAGVRGAVSGWMVERRRRAVNDGCECDPGHKGSKESSSFHHLSSGAPSVKLQPKCLFGCRLKILFVKREGCRLNNRKTNKGNGVPGVSVHSFMLKRGERFSCCCLPSTSDHISCSAQSTSKYISRAPRPRQKHNTLKGHQERRRDSWWFSNRFYFSFLSLVKRWQIHLISTVWCYMNFTGETRSSPAQMSRKPEPSCSLFCLIEAVRGKFNNSRV